MSRQPVRGAGDPSEGSREGCQLQPVSTPENSDDVKMIKKNSKHLVFRRQSMIRGVDADIGMLNPALSPPLW